MIKRNVFLTAFLSFMCFTALAVPYVTRGVFCGRSSAGVSRPVSSRPISRPSSTYKAHTPSSQYRHIYHGVRHQNHNQTQSNSSLEWYAWVAVLFSVLCWMYYMWLKPRSKYKV